MTGEPIVNHVEESTVATLNTKRGKKLVVLRGRITVILTDVWVSEDEVTAGLTGDDSTEHWTSVFTIERVVSTTITDELHVNPIKDALSQDARWDDRTKDRAFVGVLNELTITIEDGVDLVLSDARILVAETILPSIGGVLLEDGEDVAQLLLTLERETQVIDAEFWALKSGVSQIVATQGLSELNTRSRRELICRAISTNYGSSVIERAVTGNNAVQGDLAPREGIGRKRTLVGQNLDGVAHFIGPSVFLDEFEPRRSVEGLAINVRTNAVGLVYEDLFDVVCHIIINGWVGFNRSIHRRFPVLKQTDRVFSLPGARGEFSGTLIF